MRKHRIIIGLTLASMAAIAVVAATFVLYSDENDPVVVRAKARGETVIAEYEERFASREDRITTGSLRDPETLPSEGAVYSAPELCAQLASILRDMEGQTDYERFWEIYLEGDWTKDNLDFLASFFQKHAALMDGIRELASIREPFHPADSFNEEDPEKAYWVPLTYMARLLAVEMAVYVRKGSVEQAVDNCLAIIALSHSLSEEPWLLSQISKRGVFSRAFWGVETFLDPANSRLTRRNALSGNSRIVMGRMRLSAAWKPRLRWRLLTSRPIATWPREGFGRSPRPLWVRHTARQLLEE
ncbi:MAG: hypothetical protein R6V12_03040 [Candidatus Hydrogenedentota bacterium]